MQTLSIVEEKEWTFIYGEHNNEHYYFIERYIKETEKVKYQIWLRHLKEDSSQRQDYIDVPFQIIVGAMKKGEIKSTMRCKEQLKDVYGFDKATMILPKFAGTMFGFETITESLEFIEEVIEEIETISWKI